MLDLVRSIVSAAQRRLPRGLACNLLDVHAPAAHRERLFLQALRAATRTESGRSREKGESGNELHYELFVSLRG